MSAPESTTRTSLSVAAARLFWMIVGPMILAALTFNVASKGGGWLTGMDITYLAVLGLILASRWLEFQSGQGQTAEGEPLTAAGLRRYFAVTASVGLAVWVAANFIGNVWLAR